jgi:hypothetical protein
MKDGDLFATHSLCNESPSGAQGFSAGSLSLLVREAGAVLS